jgi:hypothetical protein
MPYINMKAGAIAIVVPANPLARMPIELTPKLISRPASRKSEEFTTYLRDKIPIVNIIMKNTTTIIIAKTVAFIFNLLFV